ncbi:MAG TPA: carboxypeptidase-like regulatory domain-containing protein, partial [Polyangia bacterium]
ESRTMDLQLVAGTQVNGTMRAGGVGVPGNVRLIADLGPDAVAFAGSDGSFTLALDPAGSYTPLLIPSSTTLAPHLGPKAMGASFVGGSFDIPGGVAVSGSVVDGAAAPIAGANVVLRAGALPSGPGTTNAGGAYTLYAETGAYTLSFGADDWPQGTLDGVGVPAGGTSIAVAYTIGRVAVGGTVVADDGTTPVAAARVTITSHAPLPSVANVTIGGAAAVPAGGRVARVVTTDANGVLPTMQLPLGSYDLIVEPPGPSLDGLTAVSETLAGAATWTIALAKPVPLAVTVVRGDGTPVDGAALTAVETVGLGAAPTGATDANGQYTFAIDKGATLELVVDPPASVGLAGARVPLPAGGGAVQVTLGPGVEMSGLVKTPEGKALGGVRVEALCFSCGSTTPISTSITDASGNYHLYLPDPGDVAVDGGAD